MCHYACGYPIKGPTGSEDGREGEEEVGQSGPSHSEWVGKAREGERERSVSIEVAHV